MRRGTEQFIVYRYADRSNKESPVVGVVWGKQVGIMCTSDCMRLDDNAMTSGWFGYILDAIVLLPFSINRFIYSIYKCLGKHKFVAMKLLAENNHPLSCLPCVHHIKYRSGVIRTAKETAVCSSPEPPVTNCYQPFP